MTIRAKKSISRRKFLAAFAGSTGGGLALASCRATHAPGTKAPLRAYIVPNFHPASCGWLDNFSEERVYCCNSYLDHLDRVRDDPTYKFVLSECDNMIAIMNFQPQRIPELQRRIREGRVELVNATFLEMDNNLSGGEALIKEGVEGLRWQEQVMGFSPRFCWTIDACGTHDQMGQLCSGLGLDALVYTRMNKTGSNIHWAESPDGSRILALCPGDYADFSPLFASPVQLSAREIRQLEGELLRKARTTPAGAPILVLAGSGDYSLAPLYKGYPREFLKQWSEVNPETKIEIATAGDYLNAILPGVVSGKIKIPTMRGGTGYTFDSFWIENPKVKTWYRKNEHGLHATESLATVASLRSHFKYPVQALYEGWIQMLLNMDRNTIWGSAAGMVFVSEKSWCVQDRMRSVEAINQKVQREALGSASKPGGGLVLFNPLNWERTDPMLVTLPGGRRLEGAKCQAMPDGRTLCSLRLPPLSITGVTVQSQSSARSRSSSLPENIETRYYIARVDAHTGALISLRLKPSGREMLGGPANVIVAEKPKYQKGDPGDFMLPRPERTRLASSSDFKPKIISHAGQLATTVILESKFCGGQPSRRAMTFYQDHPRIDFETELENIPNLSVIVAEFPLSEDVETVRRGIPNGFSHGAWAKPQPNLLGWAKGIVPTVRWIHFTLSSGSGVAILDQGLTGRELDGRTPIIYLYNATDKYYGYPNLWLSGAGKHHFAYALLAHETSWEEARIPHMAWEYNSPPIVSHGRLSSPRGSFLQTSDNLILQALRREANEIELRLVECLGMPGTAEVTLNLPNRGAAFTNLRGKNPTPIEGGPTYHFPVRPQQIVTMRFSTDVAVENIKPVLRWDPAVPKAKRAALDAYGNYKGHPPRGDKA
jgi:alpha-mannosidase